MWSKILFSQHLCSGGSDELVLNHSCGCQLFIMFNLGKLLISFSYLTSEWQTAHILLRILTSPCVNLIVSSHAVFNFDMSAPMASPGHF